MIIGLIGTIHAKKLTAISLLCGGVIYEVFVSIQTSNRISQGDELSLHITHVIREDAWLLFGFLEHEEKQLFDRLIKINGVGPKVAMAICSTYSPKAFARLIEKNDIHLLKKVPGIGPKSAGRLLVELSGWSLELSQTEPKEDANLEQVRLALESLGYKQEAIHKATQGLANNEVGIMIKEALKRI